MVSCTIKNKKENLKIIIKLSRRLKIMYVAMKSKKISKSYEIYFYVLLTVLEPYSHSSVLMQAKRVPLIFIYFFTITSFYFELHNYHIWSDLVFF